jgi:proline iminopeptidase
MNESHLLFSWEKRTAGSSDIPVVWFERGSGAQLLFLHGNWDHLMYIPMLEKLCDSSRILLLKQRGADCWKRPASYNHLPIEPFLADIETLRKNNGAEKLCLVGHSWGATLALQYACRQPERTEKLVLISLGPLNGQMSQFYRANVRKLVSGDRLSEFDRICHQFRDEFMSGTGVSAATEVAYADLHSTIWAYAPENARIAKQQFLAAGGFRRIAAGAHPRTTEGLLQQAETVSCPTLIMYGYQDYEPITQAFMLKEKIPHAEIRLINQCGHFPWIDQPQEFHEALDRFLP